MTIWNVLNLNIRDKVNWTLWVQLILCLIHPFPYLEQIGGTVVHDEVLGINKNKYSKSNEKNKKIKYKMK